MAAKKLLLVSMLLLSIVLLCACGDVIVEPKWVVGIKGAEAVVFSSIDYAKLDEISLTVEMSQPNGSVTEVTLQGVSFKDVLDYLGITEYSSIILTARDDSAVEYLREVAEDTSTILAVKVDGKEVWEDGFAVIRVIAANQPETMWLWNLKTLTVNP